MNDLTLYNINQNIELINYKLDGIGILLILILSLGLLSFVIWLTAMLLHLIWTRLIQVWF